MGNRGEASHSPERAARDVGTPKWVWKVLLGVATVAILANGYLVVVAIDSQPACVTSSSSSTSGAYRPARQTCH